MTDTATLGDPTMPGRFALPAGYRQRQQPEYFIDDTRDGVTWQPDVYPHAARLARQRGRDTIIDIGCGRAKKLAALAEAEPDWRFVGVDYGPNVRWCAAHLGFGQWIEADLETCTDLAICAEVLHRSLIICSDVLEHLVRPDVAHSLIRRLAVQGHEAPVVLSTPAREYRAGAYYIDEPRNPAHVREWTTAEFITFLTGSGLTIQDFRLTRSDDRSGGLTTQLVTVVPTPSLP